MYVPTPSIHLSKHCIHEPQKFNERVIKKNTYSRKCSEQKDQIMTLGEVKEEYCEDMQM